MGLVKIKATITLETAFQDNQDPELNYVGIEQIKAWIHEVLTEDRIPLYIQSRALEETEEATVNITVEKVE